MNGSETIAVAGLQCIVIVPIFILAVVLVIEGIKVLVQIKKTGKQF